MRLSHNVSYFMPNAIKIISLSLFIAFNCLFTGSANAETELEQRHSISMATKKSFLAEDFAQLEKVSALYRTTKNRTSSGLWLLTLFYGGINAAIAEVEKQAHNDADVDAPYRLLEAKTKRWAEQFPDLPTAHVTHSMVLIRHGWAYRGEGYASTVKPESWEPFFRYVAMAREHLEKYKAVAAIDPRWYEIMLLVAKAENWERDEFDRLLDEALGQEPLFYQTYFSALEYLLPKWHGSLAEIEAFAQDAVKRTLNQEGRGMYARIYWYASQTQFENDIFKDSFAVWPSMKAGFDDVVSDYPDAWNYNNYAKFACLAGDLPKTRELLKRIKSSIVPTAWNPPAFIDYCKKWVAQK